MVLLNWREKFYFVSNLTEDEFSRVEFDFEWTDLGNYPRGEFYYD